MAKFNQLAWNSPLNTQDFPSPNFLASLDSIQHQNSSIKSPPPASPITVLSLNPNKSRSFSSQNWQARKEEVEGGEEKKMRREKSMLLAFQRDDSTGFTERPGRSQRHGETGENSRTFVFSSPCLCFSHARLRMCLSLGAHSFLPLRARGV